ncbi:Ependymin [Geodia barretti]|nr:Ependymin [Geodia barretti]
MIYYNATGKKVAIHEEESEGQQREFYDEIALYEKKVLYRINRRTGECTTTSLDTPFRPIAVPPNATYYGTYYVGSTVDPLAGFKVNSFGGDTDNGRYVGTWSYVKCVPVTDSYFGEQTGFVHWSFYDVELSIEDPDVFIPPAGCHQ